ncbi:transcriptional regulator [Streptomyces sp. SID4919]|nr:transcriptional regulator [Streptomyces sp. SID4919]SCK38391.1 hypothetical protein YW7DRAFT_03255 [Streptomyces sp. AmelKG-E11A]
MTMKNLGRATGYSESYVSKVEAAKHPPSLKFVTGADRALATGGMLERQFERILVGDYPKGFLPYIELQQRARRIENYSNTFIVGMFQTKEYAQAVFDANVPRLPDEQIDGMIAARMRGLDLLDRPSAPLVWVVVHETCLRTVVGDRGLMARQLDHLTRMAKLPGVTIQVLPFSAGTPPHYLAYTLLEFEKEPTLLHVDGYREGRRYDDSELVVGAAQRYDHLRAMALSPAISLRWIAEAAEEFRDEPDSRAAVGQIQLQRLGRPLVRRGGPRIRPLGRRGSRSGQ